MAPTALLIGGTGPTGPFLLDGLVRRGYDVTLLHTGRHELPEVAHVPHVHADPFDEASLRGALEGRTFDAVVATYGRLRVTASVLAGRCGQFVSIGGAPALRGYMDPDRFTPPGLPVPSGEDGPRSDEDDDGKSYRIARTEQLVFEHQPTAAHFRYPLVYGPRQLAPREWCVVRRVLDGRRRIVVADGGLTLKDAGYVENLAHAVLLALDHPEKAAGQIFNAADLETLTIAQIIEIIAAELGHTFELVSMPWELALPARPMVAQHRPTHRVLDTSKLVTLLGYRDVVPAREAMARTARWLAEHPCPRDGVEELVLEDPFDYGAEDRLIDAWQAATGPAGAVADAVAAFAVVPGLGKAYYGPGASIVRPDTRI
jgi:nucleoside-diphosphate-sugar epimerase